MHIAPVRQRPDAHVETNERMLKSNLNHGFKVKRETQGTWKAVDTCLSNWKGLPPFLQQTSNPLPPTRSMVPSEFLGQVVPPASALSSGVRQGQQSHLFHLRSYFLHQDRTLFSVLGCSTTRASADINKLHAQTSFAPFRCHSFSDSLLRSRNMDTEQRTRKNDSIDATQDATTHHPDEKKIQKN